ncbi:MAG: GNAT family N-acetyltransferase [Gammaproteobacteria bacterium]|nr:GNAT family N-acetyltransferase [Gammaproteobacteria bacterium]
MALAELKAIPEIHSRRLRLEGLRPEHAAPLHAGVFSREKVMHYTTLMPFESLEHTAEFIDEQLRGFRERRSVHWLASEKNGDDLVGIVSLHDINLRHERAELGYVLTESAWGKGHASEIVASLLRFGFHTLGLARIEAEVAWGNEASIRVLEKNGLRKEGVRQARYRKGDTFRDATVFGMLAPRLR